MAAAITELRAAIKATLEAEWPDIPVKNDKLHDAMGIGSPIAAVYPEGERPYEGGMAQAYLVSIQLFLAWDPQIDPAQEVDPAIIEDYAWRLQRRMRTESRVNSANMSYYVPNGVIYPDDPTGNKTRFVMDIVGYDESPALGETSP